jgi:hypothetical protein
MATTEEKQELIDDIKGPRFYRVTLWGYGGESAYIPLTTEQYEFWSNHIDEFGDSDVVQYMVSESDDEPEFEDMEVVPPEADFMKDEEGDYSSWFEHHKELEHQWGVAYSEANITIEEVENDDYNADTIQEVVEGESLEAWVDEIQSSDDYETEIVKMGVSDYEEWTAEHILQFYSAEKGQFFDAIIETTGEFDPKKLMIHTSEYANGDDTVTSIEYDGEELDNNGGDSNGKGYYVYVWSNE